MTSLAVGRPYFQTDFQVSEFAERRQCVAEAIGKDCVAVVRGAPDNAAFEVFRQYNDLYYLCGVEVPHAYLLVEGQTGRAKLYLPRRDEKREHSDGPQLNCDGPQVVREITGIDEVGSLTELASDVRLAKTIFTPLAGGEGRQMCRDTIRLARKAMQDDPWGDRETPEQRFARRLTAATAISEAHDLSPTLDRLRLNKSDAELALMRRAGKLSSQAVVEAIKRSRPGMMEYQLAAVADEVYRDGGAQGPGYGAIVASGPNIWNAHYNRLNCELRDDDLVLMDYAPDVGYYTSDIGRIWPASGKFCSWHRELYGFVVEYHKTLLRMIRPGVTAAQILEEAAAAMRPIVESTAWSSANYRAAAEAMLIFRGHLSHPVGMAVHDVGDYRAEPLRPGLVFAVDPQLWVPDNKTYIRVEDTVIVTDRGIEVLTGDAPVEIDAIEQLARRL